MLPDFPAKRVHTRGLHQDGRLFVVSGPTLQQKLDHLTEALAEAEREYAAGVPYPDHIEGSWPEKISSIKQHIDTLREMIANE